MRTAKTSAKRQLSPERKTVRARSITTGASASRAAGITPIDAIGWRVTEVVHDMKTPLAVIDACAKLMRDAPTRRARGHHATLIQRQVDHICAMQRSLIAYARGEATLFVHSVDLPRFAERLRDEFAVDLGARGVELVIDLRERGTARFDETSLLRAIHNLVQNASEAIGRNGGEIALRISRDTTKKALVVTCTDSGPGLANRSAAGLFKPLATAAKRGGAGLGLAIVKRVAEAHGGSVRARSTKRGATFTVTIPQA